MTSMYTVCPKCALTLAVTAGDLRVAQGHVRCGRCSHVFNALTRLTSDDRQEEPQLKLTGSDTLDEALPEGVFEFNADASKVFAEPLPAPKWTPTGTYRGSALRPEGGSATPASAFPNPSDTAEFGAVEIDLTNDALTSATLETPILKPTPEAAEPTRRIPPPRTVPGAGLGATQGATVPSRGPASTPPRPPVPPRATATPAGSAQASRFTVEPRSVPPRSVPPQSSAPPRSVPPQSAPRPAAPQSAPPRTAPPPSASRPTQPQSVPPRGAAPPSASRAASAGPATRSGPATRTPGPPPRPATVPLARTTPPAASTPVFPQQPAPAFAQQQAPVPVSAGVWTPRRRRMPDPDEPVPQQRSTTRETINPRQALVVRQTSGPSTKAAAQVDALLAAHAAKEARAVAQSILTRTPGSHAQRYRWGAVGLSLLLGAQAVNHYRNDLATHPALRAPLTSLYGLFGVKLVPRWDLSAYDVRRLGASTTAPRGGQIMLRASIKNAGSQPQPMPLLRITLQDQFGNPVAARDVQPASYLPVTGHNNGFMSAGERIDAEIAFADPGPKALNYTIDACLPSPEGGTACANQ